MNNCTCNIVKSGQQNAQTELSASATKPLMHVHWFSTLALTYAEIAIYFNGIIWLFIVFIFIYPNKEC